MAKSPMHNGQVPATMSGPTLRVQRANRFVFDQEGLWHCTIVSITPQPAPDPSRAPRFRWTLEGPGTVRPWQLHFTTPQEIGEAIDEAIDEEGVSTEEVNVSAQEPESVEPESLPLNALARVCISLGLLIESQLSPSELDATLEDFDLASAIGLSVMCRIAKKNTAFIDGAMRPCNPYYTPVLDTLQVDD